jgi:uncharacterized DUF497 family protein
VHFEWDPIKEAANRAKHGLSFGDATALFTSEVEYLEFPDQDHSEDEDRLIAIGPVARGVILVVFTERDEESIRIISARPATKAERRLYIQFIEENL